jgi:thiol-disulfide isomerase/thioredoxin
MNIEDEKELKLSSLLKDKYILIDMWGSWCGPCIVKTRTMKPLYEKYKESGFNIIGIAREFKSLKAVKNRIKVENYVWPNLYDLDDKYQIWNKYGIGYGTGLMVLVDDKGRILAIDPTAEEVEKIIISN